MRALSLGVVALSFLAMSLPVTGQDAPAAVRVIEDPEGDEDVTVADQHTGRTQWPASDLLSLDVLETSASLRMVLHVRDLVAGPTPADDIFYEVRFVAEDAPYGLRLFLNFDGSADGSFCAPDPDFGDFLFCSDPVTVTPDAAADTLTVDIPLGLLVPASGGRMMKGDELHSFRATATSVGGSVVSGYTLDTVDASDAMPDAGTGTVAYAITSGAEQVGHLLAGSVRPVRVSNGEATTMLFEVEVRNTLDRHDTVALAVEGAPSEWVVTLPDEEVRIDGGESATVPVLVTTPFNHDHGAYRAFNVTATSRSDPLAVGRIELAVRYTKVPQPAGHHDTVFLHGANGPLYVNTLEGEEIPPGEESEDPVVGGGCSSGSSSGNAMTELVPLVPPLQMGLDVDLGKTGLARIQLTSQAPIVDGYSVSGLLLAWRGGDRPSTCQTEAGPTTIAVIERSAPFSIDAGETIVVEAPITPQPAGDYLPYGEGLNLALQLILWEEGPAHPPICCLGSEAPTFVPGSSFKLPLAEYHDPVDQYFSSLSGVELFAVTQQQRLVNPGETVVFRLEAQNIGSQDAAFDLQLTGTNTQWATVLGDARVPLGAGLSRELAVAVTVPSGASNGEMADITLHAVKTDDANVRSLIRLLATVDDSQDHPDEAGEVDGIDKSLTGNEAPLGPFVAVLAVALAVAFRRRR